MLRLPLIGLIGLIAVTNPQSGNVGVTATMPNIVRPDTPVLVSPANNATISTTAPSFIFSPSSGETLVSHYQLWLDGVKNTDHIPQSYSTISSHALTALSEGTHTWMVKAIGTNSTERDSSIWSFTIDTTAPLILINQVAGQAASLSSLDLTPWQKEIKFQTSNRHPAINGQSEAGALVSISFNDQTVSAVIAGDRTFSLKPKTALVPGRYTVSVTSSDPAGNNTSLPSFYLEISPAAGAITIPLPSPLPNLSFTVPVIVPPSLPQLPTAFPLIPRAECPCSWLPWLLVILLILYIIISRQRPAPPSGKTSSWPRPPASPAAKEPWAGRDQPEAGQNKGQTLP